MRTNNNEKNENISDNEKPVVSSGQNIAIIIGTILFPVIGVAMGYPRSRNCYQRIARQ